MRGEPESPVFESACHDLRERTLTNMPGDFARLIYLASTRDYNSGAYHHAGLTRQFNEEAAQHALETCHKEVFKRLVLRSVAELVQEVETYVRSTRLPLSSVIRAWSRLQPYEVTVPADCSSLTARLFASNVMAALAVLAAREGLVPPDRQSA